MGKCAGSLRQNVEIFSDIPADPDVRREWIARINRNDLRLGDVTPNTQRTLLRGMQNRGTPGADLLCS